MSSPSTQEESSISFEEAYARLETILTELNQGEVALEKSLKLYEEANTLILTCHQKLTNAEQKIQHLIKHRNGELALDSKEKPTLQDFDPKREEILTRDL